MFPFMFLNDTERLHSADAPALPDEQYKRDPTQHKLDLRTGITTTADNSTDSYDYHQLSRPYLALSTTVIVLRAHPNP
jgi:hypothetical protein